MSEYPEHDKLSAVKDESQAIGEFLDLGRWTLCELREWEDGVRPSFEPVDIQASTSASTGMHWSARSEPC